MKGKKRYDGASLAGSIMTLYCYLFTTHYGTGIVIGLLGAYYGYKCRTYGGDENAYTFGFAMSLIGAILCLLKILKLFPYVTSILDLM